MNTPQCAPETVTVTVTETETPTYVPSYTTTYTPPTTTGVCHCPEEPPYTTDSDEYPEPSSTHAVGYSYTDPIPSYCHCPPTESVTITTAEPSCTDEVPPPPSYTYGDASSTDTETYGDETSTDTGSYSTETDTVEDPTETL